MDVALPTSYVLLGVVHHHSLVDFLYGAATRLRERRQDGERVPVLAPIADDVDVSIVKTMTSSDGIGGLPGAYHSLYHFLVVRAAWRRPLVAQRGLP